MPCPVSTSEPGPITQVARHIHSAFSGSMRAVERNSPNSPRPDETMPRGPDRTPSGLAPSRKTGAASNSTRATGAVRTGQYPRREPPAGWSGAAERNAMGCGTAISPSAPDSEPQFGIAAAGSEPAVGQPRRLLLDRIAGAARLAARRRDHRRTQRTQATELSTRLTTGGTRPIDLGAHAWPGRGSCAHVVT